MMLLLLCFLSTLDVGWSADPPHTVYVLPSARSSGDGSSQRPFTTIKEAVRAGLNQPPSTTTWTILLREGSYEGPGQVEITIRDTKRYIIWFENRGVNVHCDHAEFFVDFSGLAGRGSLEITGNGGSITECFNGAIRSRRKTSVSSVRFLRNRSLLQGSALRVESASSADHSSPFSLSDVIVEDCWFEDQMQRPLDAPSAQNDEGGGALWAMGTSSVQVLNSVFLGNEASQGGAMYIRNSKSVLIKGSSFVRNRALLNSVGGGAVAVVSSDPSSTVTIVDTLMEQNESGGNAGGLYLGGKMSLNLTRVVVANNSCTGDPETQALNGVGMLIWEGVQGTATNVTIEGNGVEGVLYNFACDGPFLGNDCELLWNQKCDLCKRNAQRNNVLLTEDACMLGYKFVMKRLYLLLILGCGASLGLVVGISLFFYFRSKGRLAGEQARGNSGDDESASIMMVERKSSASSLAGSNGSVGEHDFDDPPLSSEEVLLEPPGYERRSSNDEILPSSDFLRHSPLPQVSFKEIDYDELDLDPEPIGSGAFGLVYRAYWRGSVVAVKKFIGTLDAQGVLDFRAEAQLIHAVGNHPNVIKLFGACTLGPNYCLVIPYYPHGSVRDFFRSLPEGKRTWGLVRNIALQIVAGMMHLHRENIIHRDLAARNILVDDNNTIHISDFGLARFLREESRTTNSNLGAVAWMAPEAVAKRVYSTKSDIWSFGVTLWEMCTGELPFSGTEVIHVAVSIAKGATLSVPEYVPEDLANVMRRCWAINPADRPNFEELYALLKNNNSNSSSNNNNNKKP